MDMLRFDTEIGTCGVRWSELGLTGVLLPRSRGLADAEAPEVPDAVAAAVEAMTALLAGEPRDLRGVALDWAGIDDFRRAVYDATRDIQPGATATYGEIARTVGAPDAARAVGAALGSNPFPIVVPCHRVLAANGALHGFSAPGGIVTKRRMLEIEQAPGFTQEALFH
jgi:methylated-DNA-[protein]-cysteine S-methyltransferase